MKYLEIAELLKSLNNSCLCESLGQDENVLSVAVDPTCNPDPESVSYQAVACEMITGSEHSKTVW